MFSVSIVVSVVIFKPSYPGNYFLEDCLQAHDWELEF